MSNAPKKTGLSLYADLLDGGRPKSDSRTVITGAPVKYDLKKMEADAAEAARKKDGIVT